MHGEVRGLSQHPQQTYFALPAPSSTSFCLMSENTAGCNGWSLAATKKNDSYGSIGSPECAQPFLPPQKTATYGPKPALSPILHYGPRRKSNRKLSHYSSVAEISSDYP